MKRFPANNLREKPMISIQMDNLGPNTNDRTEPEEKIG
ncbi:hypothetical protein NTH_02296 [Nitratireductor thuwali]|uniref:Uncharacterized protein n=1 Tax=Nitratireductor thuwali TaxID=2267699 RepID=A0ABY5MIJ8_9HYPH|nr:hypothetical protein NTH_02296 [Nitratireductor thuwali]